MKPATALSYVLLAFASCSAVQGQDDAKRLPVYLANGLPAEHVIALSGNIAAGNEGGILLLDAPKSRPYLRAFIHQYRPAASHPIGSFADGIQALSADLKVKLSAPVAWQEGIPEELAKRWFDTADEVVVVAAEPRRLLLQAACLAGAARAPLYLLTGKNDNELLRRKLAAWKTRTIHAVGEAALRACGHLADIKTQALADEHAVVDAYLQRLQQAGPIQTFVLANPEDNGSKRIAMSTLAPWVASQRRAVLLLTNANGGDASELVNAAMKKPALAHVENIIIVADLQAIPMKRRPNPLPGKDEHIELEPPAPPPDAPFTFATGRLFDEEPGIVSLMLARRHLLAADGPRRAMIVSNPGGGLPLLETISRHTASELRNAGFETIAWFGRSVRPGDMRRALPAQDLILWEGHHSTLVSDFGVPHWPEPLRPALVWLQSCLALSEEDAHPFLRRGAIAVVGTRSRTYSASGGAFTLAYLNAMNYDRQSLGAALRQSKNFMLAYARLKEKRLGNAAKLAGASVRSAWAFTLWGDPTVTLPAPPSPKNALAAFRAHVEGDRVRLTLPGTAYPQVETAKYTATLWPNGRLAGYLTKLQGEERKRLLPLLFAEVRLKAPAASKAPVPGRPV